MRIGVDTGGTFTDVVLLSDEGEIASTHKLLSTPDDPSQAVLNGIHEILAKYQNTKADTSETIDVVHGSTVATNALLELRDLDKPQSAMVFTEGFTDLLAIARQTRPNLYALSPSRPKPPIPRSHCVGVKERLNAQGYALEVLNNESVREVCQSLVDLDVESVAICLLHSYANPKHERAVAAAIREAIPNVHLTVSSELLPEYREYERAATCAINAVVAPKMGAYIKRLEDELGEDHLRIIGSHGGTLPGKATRHHPVRTILSGPAGGVLGAIHAGKLERYEHLITFDMGGTSTDVSLINNGAARLSREQTAAGLPVRLPMVDIHTVGAGGGSIAWVDHGGALRVGPQSAGADPGPACYGKQKRNQPLATVTDAHVVLGHIPKDTRLGEDLTIDADASTRVVKTVAEKLNLSVEETATGILKIAEVTMTKAIGQISLQLGYDPRDYTLVSFGGAGGFHACNLADQMGIKRVLIPTNPGLLSAVGMLSAKPIYTFSQTLFELIDADCSGQYRTLSSVSEIQTAIDVLEAKAKATLQEDGIASDEVLLEHYIDLRYANQSYEITVSLDETDPIRVFEDEHCRLYGYIAEGKPIEVVAVRVHATTRASKTVKPHTISKDITATETKLVEVTSRGETLQFNHYLREQLMGETLIPEHSIISEYSSTIIVPSGWRGVVSSCGQLILTKEVG